MSSCSRQSKCVCMQIDLSSFGVYCILVSRTVRKTQSRPGPTIFFNTGLNHFLRMHPDPMAWGRGDGKGRKEENEKEIGGFLSRKRDLKEWSQGDKDSMRLDNLDIGTREGTGRQLNNVSLILMTLSIINRWKLDLINYKQLINWKFKIFPLSLLMNLKRSDFISCSCLTFFVLVIAWKAKQCIAPHNQPIVFVQIG